MTHWEQCLIKLHGLYFLIYTVCFNCFSVFQNTENVAILPSSSLPSLLLTVKLKLLLTFVCPICFQEFRHIRLIWFPLTTLLYLSQMLYYCFKIVCQLKRGESRLHLLILYVSGNLLTVNSAVCVRSHDRTFFYISLSILRGRCHKMQLSKYI